MTIGRGDIRWLSSRTLGLPTKKEAQSSASGARNASKGKMDFRHLAFLLLLAVCDLRTVASRDSLEDARCRNVTGILDCLLEGYDKRIRPNYGGYPVEVGISMYVLDMGPISEENGEFTFDCYFRQNWTDPRLAFPLNAELESISVGSEYGQNLWMPDTFIVNERRTETHKYPANNEFLRILRSGSVVRSTRVTVTASCPMNFQYYPMDSQVCSIEIESYGHSMKDIQYRWQNVPQPVGISYSISIPQYHIIGHRLRSVDALLTTGNYSRLACEFQFTRTLGHYILQIYIPAAFVVVVSWTTFWLNRNALTTRMALGIITLTVMGLLSSCINSNLPKVPYMKALDLYLGICFLMVFAALLEYITVCYIMKKIQNKKSRYLAIQKLADETNQGNETKTGVDGGAAGQKSTEVRFNVYDSKVVTTDKGIENGKLEEEGKTSTIGIFDKLCGISPANLDKYSRILFPSSFVCFNLMYWIIYLNITDSILPNLITME